MLNFPVKKAPSTKLKVISFLVLSIVIFVGCTQNSSTEESSTSSSSSSSESSAEAVFQPVPTDAAEICKLIDRAGIFINNYGERLSYQDSTELDGSPEDCIFSEGEESLQIVATRLTGEDASEFYTYNQGNIDILPELEKLTNIDGLGDSAYGYSLEADGFTSIDVLKGDTWINVIIDFGDDPTTDQIVAREIVELLLSE